MFRTTQFIFRFIRYVVRFCSVVNTYGHGASVPTWCVCLLDFRHKNYAKIKEHFTKTKTFWTCTTIRYTHQTGTQNKLNPFTSRMTYLGRNVFSKGPFSITVIIIISIFYILRRWADNIKMDLQEVGGGCGDWMELAEDRDRWRALVSTVMNLRFPKMRRIPWLAAEPISFSRRTLLHGVSK